MSKLSVPDVPSRPPLGPCSFYQAERYSMTDSLGHQLVRLMIGLRREVETRMGALGLTDAQWKPLWILKQGAISTSFELAREMDIDAGALTRMLDRLEAKGLIERARSATDRRVVNLALTPAGDAVVAQVPNVLAAVNNDFLRGFSEEEWTQLKDFVGRMQANSDDMRSSTEAATAAAKEKS